MKTLLSLLFLGSALGANVSEPWMVCYFSSWAVYRPGLGQFDVPNIDPNLCTHAIFGFAGLSNQTWTIEVLDPWNENCASDVPPGNNCAYQKFTQLKLKNPRLKTILAVGGWNEGSEDYSVMVADPIKRAVFIDSCIALVEKENFDGLDIDWEYPNQRGGVEADKANFITLLDEFRVKFDQRGLLMTAALANGNPNSIGTSYDVAGLVRNLDVMNIMTYDFHGAWEKFTHHNSPLCSYPTDTGDFLYFNVEASINYWLEMGAPPEKMVMGIPLYGRCFTLDNIDDNGMLANASKPGVKGPYTRLPGTQGWNEICVRIKDTSDCTVVHDPLLNEPYMYCKRDNLWCGYDDEESATLKAKFAKSKGLAGSVFWTIDTDDFVPECSDRRFGIINTVKDVFNDPAPAQKIECGNMPTVTPPVTTEEETTLEILTTVDPFTTDSHTTIDSHSTPDSHTTIDSHTTPDSHTTVMSTTPGEYTTPGVFPEKPDCSLDDTYYYPHSDCNKYWWCVSGKPILMLCGPGTFYNPVSELCDYPDNIDTSHCRVWVCEADGDTFPGADCNEFYVCEHGSPVQFFCNYGLYYNPAIAACDFPNNVNTETCNIPAALKEDVVGKA